MSDSDSELLTTNNVFTFQNESTTVSARGPNINTSNLTGFSFRHNVLTSTMNKPRNYDWQRRAESNYDQRSIGYRRETSPMSIASACDARQRNFNSFYHTKGMSSQRSVYNGRGGSPMSMRSIDSNATVSATDIAMALKNSQFNKYDMKILQEACNKFMKHKARKRIEKRRNLRLFLKGYRRKSGNDSGELGSNSSISSDDNMSTRTRRHRNNRSSCRSTKTEVSDFRRIIADSDIITDCSNNFRQNRLLGMVSKPANLNSTKSSANAFRRTINEAIPKSMPPPENVNKTQIQNAMTQRDRFKNGFLLPSQRFNRSVAEASIPETAENPHMPEINHGQNKELDIHTKRPPDVNSDDEEIFSDITTIEKPTKYQRKRSIDSDDDICLPNNKRSKVASPCKNMSMPFKNSTTIEKAKNDFEFAKPAFPVRKSANIKAKEKIISTSANINTTEKLIAKSHTPLSVQDISLQPKENEEKGEIDNEVNTEQSTISQNTTDLSMRPSFIKRKLFTQNMEVTEKTNDILAANSPQNSVYGAIQKERNKTRKLVTSQYYLSRDIDTEENNLLDLIHKIVPAERMNATNQTNKTVPGNKPEDNDNWDVTSIISTRNNDDNVSDTFTDEDTLNTDNGKAPSPIVTKKKVEKTPPKVIQATKKVLVEKNGTPSKTVQKYVKSFWDTDFESDAEGTKPPASRAEIKENQKIDNLGQVAPKAKFHGFSSMFPASKTFFANTSVMNNTVDSVQKFNNTNRSLKLYSHRNNKPKKAAPVKDAKSLIEPLPLKQKTTKVASCIDLTMQEDIDETCNLNNKKQDDIKPVKTKTVTKKTTPKKRKANKEKDEVTHKVAKENQQTKTPNDKISTTDEKAKPQNNKEKESVTNKKESGTTVINKPNNKLIKDTEKEPQPDIVKDKTNSKKSGTSQNKAQDKKESKANKNKTKNNCKESETPQSKQEVDNAQNKPNAKSGSSQNKAQDKKESKANQNKTKNNCKESETPQSKQEVDNAQNKPNAKSGSSQNKAQDKKESKVNQNKTKNNCKESETPQSKQEVDNAQNKPIAKSGSSQNKAQDKKESKANQNKTKNNHKESEIPQSKQKADNVQNKPNAKSNSSQNKSQYKEESKENENKTKINKERNLNTIRNKCNNTQNKRKSPRNTKNEKANNKIPIQGTLKNTQKRTSKKANLTKLTDSLIYEDTFTETNNNSIRPVRSCRISKQNETLNASKANQTHNISLRSQDASKTKINVPQKNKLAKNTKTRSRNDQSILSDLSFSLVHDKKKYPSIKSFFKPIQIDTSDVSFSLNNKDSPFNKQKGHSISDKHLLQNPIIVLRQMNKNSLNIKDRYSSKNEIRSARKRLPNSRFLT